MNEEEWSRKKRKNCIVCEKELPKGKIAHTTAKSVRYLTCSKDCSKKYMRIVNFIRGTYKIKQAKLQTLQDVCEEIEKRIEDLKEAQKGFIKNNEEENPIIQAKLTEVEYLLKEFQGGKK